MSKKKKKSPFTNAFDRMKPAKPYDLRSEDTEIKATKKVAPQKGVPQSEIIQVEKPHKEVIQFEASQADRTQFEVTQVDGTQIKQLQIQVPKNEIAQSDSTQNEKRISKGTQKEVSQIQVPPIEIPGSKLDQVEVSQNDKPNKKLPQIEGPQSKGCQNGKAGYFKMSHSIFSNFQIQALSGDSFRLYIWACSRAWRFKDSNGVLRASIQFVAAETGIAKATVSRALKALQDEKLVTLVEKDFKRGNVWKVSPLALGETKSKIDFFGPELPQKEGTQKKREATSKIGRSSLKLREKLPQNEGHYKKSKNFKKPLNTKMLPEALENYFSSLKTQSKKISEYETFIELKKHFPIDD